MEALSIVHEDALITLEIYYRTERNRPEQQPINMYPKRNIHLHMGPSKNKIRPIIFWLG